jgi:drug/metabolite transporter (DMT)-like permease
MASLGFFVKPLSATLGVVEVVGLRFVLSLVVVVFLAFISGQRLVSGDLKAELLMGLVSGFVVLLYFVSINSVGVSLAALLLYTAPFFAALFSSVLLGERHGVGRIVALLFSFLGIVLIIRPSFALDVSLLLAVGAGVLYGFKMVLTRRVGRVDSTWVITFYFLLVPSVMFASYMMLHFDSFVVPSFRDVLLLFGLVIVSTVLGFLLQHHGFRLVEVGPGSVVLMTEAVVAVLIGVVVFGEFLDFLTVLGGFLVVSSGAYLALNG